MSSSAEASSSSTARLPPKVRPDPIPKSTSTSTNDPFATLPPAFDADRFQPPEWARNMAHLSNSSGGLDEDQHAGPSGTRAEDEEGDDAESLGLSEQDTVWEDAREEFDDGVDEATGEFTLDELRRLLDKATGLKTEGNGHFTAKPPKYDEAIQAYQAALGCLPIRKPKVDIPDEPSDPSQAEINTSSSSEQPTSSTAPPPPPPPARSGIQELTEAEAAALEAELSRTNAGEEVEKKQEKPKTEEEEKEEVFEAISELRKVCYGNLGAVWLAEPGKEKECVEVCTEALKIDAKYTKALQRRATANDRLNTWSSLTSAQEDYTALLSLLPSSQLPPIRRSLAALPERITAQQQLEKDEMISKLKDLGNGLLGKFGLSTDMFKFDQQEGGGYSMRFER